MLSWWRTVGFRKNINKGANKNTTIPAILISQGKPMALIIPPAHNGPV